MKILVLGGAGYIGSHTVYALLDAGHSVVVADNLLTGFRSAVHPEAKFYLGDIRDSQFLNDLFAREKVDVVIHFAACSLVGESVKDPLKYYDNNLYGTKVLLEAMVAQRRGQDRLLLHGRDLWRAQARAHPGGRPHRAHESPMARRSWPWRRCSSG